MLSPRKLGRGRPRSLSIRSERGVKRSLTELPEDDEDDRPIPVNEKDAIDALRAVATSPDEGQAKFARFALRMIGEQIFPHKLSHQVPLWTNDDVRYWVTKIGFGAYSQRFEEEMVDGDLLLLMTDEEIERDIGIGSGLLRKRFRRELDSLKVAADYSCIDETQMNRILMSHSPQLSIYTYRLLEMGIDTKNLSQLSDDMLANVCGITNPIHRNKILQVSNVCAQNEDAELAILRQQIDVFISYRRSTGNQLASLIKVLLQLRSHKVFIDVDRLHAGHFDQSLWKNIQAANHFILVLTPSSLDRLLDDHNCEDWVHKEIKCALEHGRNVIPVFEQNFQWPDENRLPADIRCITKFNAVRWVHEYQEACVDKLEKFIAGELTLPPTSSTRTCLTVGSSSSIGDSKAGQLSNHPGVGENNEQQALPPLHVHGREKGKENPKGSPLVFQWPTDGGKQASSFFPATQTPSGDEPQYPFLSTSPASSIEVSTTTFKSPRDRKEAKNSRSPSPPPIP